MNNRHAANFQRLFDTVQISPGETDPDFRRAIEEQSAALSISASETMQEIPPELANYVNKVALNAYKVTDEDIEALKRAGYSEDAIFEITLSVAIGAGRVRLNRGLAALKGEQQCD
ncbi:MAG: carboxymuconolactone decarboxylase family protein [Ktedonobacteraceae bacterium]